MKPLPKKQIDKYKPFFSSSSRFLINDYHKSILMIDQGILLEVERIKMQGEEREIKIGRETETETETERQTERQR